MKKLNNQMAILQIDVIAPVKNDERYMNCNLYTGERCVKIFMAKADYEALKQDGFFIRLGVKEDSAGVLNTTNVFTETI